MSALTLNLSIDEFEVLTAIVVHDRVFVSDLMKIVSPRPLEELVEQLEALEDKRLIESRVFMTPTRSGRILVWGFTKCREARDV